MSQPKNIMVACDQIDPPQNACKIKPQKVKRLVKSIQANGLLQPPGVVAIGDRYRLVYGNHRFQAWQKLGHTEIEVRLLPPDTSVGQELSISLQENHVRENEDFEDTFARVEQRAKQMNCSFKKAAELENVSPTYVSRAKKILDRLGRGVIQKSQRKRRGHVCLVRNRLCQRRKTSARVARRLLSRLPQSRIAGQSREAKNKGCRQKSHDWSN